MVQQLIKFIVFDSDELSATLIEKYVRELKIPAQIIKKPKFDSDIFKENNLSYNFIFVDISKENAHVLDEISMFSSNPRNIFFMMSLEPNSDLYVKSLRSGVKEFLRKPIEKDSFIKSLSNVYKTEKPSENSGRRKYSKLISVTSLEKGCGKTFFAINTARELAEKTKDRVLLIDFNDNFNNVTFNLDIDQIYDTNYFIQNTTNENAKQILSKLYKYKDTSMYVMSNCMYRAKTDSCLRNDNLENFVGIIKRFFRFIIVDINDDLDIINKTIFLNSNMIFYIISSGIKANEKNQSFLDANYDKKHSSNNVKIILNKYRDKDEQKIGEIEAILGREIFYKIPMNLSVTTGSTVMGRTIREINPNLDILNNYDKIADYIINKV